MSEQLKAKADLLQHQGIKLAKNKDLQDAIQLWEEALKIYQMIGEKQGSGNVLGNLGIAYHFLPDYQRALTYHQESLALEKEIRNDVKGTVPRTANVNDYQFREYTSRRQIGTLKSLAYIHFSLGFTYYWLNEYAEAIIQYQNSLKIVRDLKDTRSEAIVLGDLGEVYFYLGQYKLSIKHQEEALKKLEEIEDLEKLERIEDLDLQGECLNSIGNGYSKLGEWKEARYFYRKALSIFEKIGDDTGQGNAIGGIGVSLANEKNYKEAIDYFEKNVHLFKKRDFEPGNRLYNYGVTLNHLGQAYYSLGDYSKAIDYHQESLKVALELDDVFSQEKAHSNLAFCFYRLNRLEEAEDNLRVSIDLVESIRNKLGHNDEFKVSIFDQQTEPYQLLQVVLIAQEKIEQALEIAERSRARALAELLARRSELSDSESIVIESPSIDLIKRIATKQKATLVEYSLIQTFGLEPKLYIWVVSPDGLIKFETVDLTLTQSQRPLLLDLALETSKPLGIEERFLRQRNASKGTQLPQHLNFQEENMSQLYEYLVDKIAKYLPTLPNSTIIFVPQGDLFLVPFSSLKNPRTNEYLIEKYNISITSSLQILDLTDGVPMDRRLGKSDTIEALIIGNPSVDLVGNSNSLPAAEAEAKAISFFFETETLIGEEATKTRILKKLPKAKLVHIAAHATLDYIGKSGIPGAILVAPENDREVNLTAEDLMKIFGDPNKSPSLLAQLIVLSGCVTGLGRITGEGIIGLSRSFMAAGIPSLVASLWPVDDLATAFLMCKFYEHLLFYKNVPQALREAQIWLRNVTLEDLKQYTTDLPFDDNLKKELIRMFRKNNRFFIKKNPKLEIQNIRPFESPYYWAAFFTTGKSVISL